MENTLEERKREIENLSYFELLEVISDGFEKKYSKLLNMNQIKYKTHYKVTIKSIADEFFFIFILNRRITGKAQRIEHSGFIFTRPQDLRDISTQAKYLMRKIENGKALVDDDMEVILAIIYKTIRNANILSKVDNYINN